MKHYKRRKPCFYGEQTSVSLGVGVTVECNFLEFHSRRDFFRVPLSACFVWVDERTSQHDRNSLFAPLVTLSRLF